MECYTNINNPDPGLCHMFQSVDDRSRRTRTTGTKYMKVPNIRSSMGRKAYSYWGPSFWNCLDSDTRGIDTKDAFKRHISKTICRDVNHPGWAHDNSPVFIHDVALCITYRINQWIIWVSISTSSVCPFKMSRESVILIYGGSLWWMCWLPSHPLGGLGLLEPIYSFFFLQLRFSLSSHQSCNGVSLDEGYCSLMVLTLTANPLSNKCVLIWFVFWDVD